MAGKPPDDAGGYAHQGSEFGGRPDEPFGADDESSPWYLKPWVLAIWGVLVIVLVAVIIYGLIELAHGSGAGKPAPTRPSTTTTSSTTTPTTATTPSSAPSSTVQSTTTLEPTGTAPPVSTTPPTPQTPRHHWWTDLPIPTTRLPYFPH